VAETDAVREFACRPGQTLPDPARPSERDNPAALGSHAVPLGLAAGQMAGRAGMFIVLHGAWNPGARCLA